MSLTVFNQKEAQPGARNDGGKTFIIPCAVK